MRGISIVKKISVYFLIFSLLLTSILFSNSFSTEVKAASLLSDNFESYSTFPSGGWTTAVSTGSWTVTTDGTKVAKNNVSSTGTFILTNGNSAWTNYTFSADVKPGSVGTRHGIVFRYVDTSNYYYFAFKDGSKVYLYKKVNGSESAIAYGNFTYNSSTFYNMKVTVNGSAITCYVNGAQVLSGSDSTLAAGKVALFSFGNASFDNVAIDDGGTSTPTPTPTATPTPTPTSTPTPTPTSTPSNGRTITCDTTAEIQNALKNALPGDTIIIKPGTYTGSSSTSGNSGAYFYSGVSGTADAHITVISESSTSPAILQGSSTSSLYVLYITGDYWDVKDLKITKAKKGIMLDSSNYTTLYNCEVYGIGEEGIHLRDGSSYCVVEKCNVYDTGLVTADYGEGIYVGSDNGKWGTYAKECDYNIIRDCTIGKCKAEPIDIKEGTTGTIVEGCIFDGTGISGANSADSFMDVKGNNGIVRNNIAYQKGNSIIVNAFEVHQRATGCGLNNDFYGNTVYMDSTSPYVVYTDANATARAHNNTRSPSGNMYSGNVTEY